MPNKCQIYNPVLFWCKYEAKVFFCPLIFCLSFHQKPFWLFYLSRTLRAKTLPPQNLTGRDYIHLFFVNYSTAWIILIDYLMHELNLWIKQYGSIIVWLVEFCYKDGWKLLFLTNFLQLDNTVQLFLLECWEVHGHPTDLWVYYVHAAFIPQSSLCTNFNVRPRILHPWFDLSIHETTRIRQ